MNYEQGHAVAGSRARRRATALAPDHHDLVRLHSRLRAAWRWRPASGAVARQVMGTTVIGGMLAATLIAIFLIPVLFYLVERFMGKKKKAKAVESEPVALRPAQSAPRM